MRLIGRSPEEWLVWKDKFKALDGQGFSMRHYRYAFNETLSTGGVKVAFN